METKMAIVTWCVVAIVVAPVLLVCCSAAPTPEVKVASSLSVSNDTALNDKEIKLETPNHPFPSSSSSSSSSSSIGYDQIKQAQRASAKSPVSSGSPLRPTSRDRIKSPRKTTPDDEEPKEKGAAGDGKQGGIEPGRPPAQRKPLGTEGFTADADDDDDDGLRYLLFGDDGRWQQKQAVSRSPFSSSVPPLAMAEYLLLTGDFSGFDGALEDIVAIGMMTSAEAGIYRLQVGAEYQSLIKQETEAEIADLYDDYRKVVPTYPEGGEIGNYPLGSFIPPFALGYSDYGYYDNPNNDVMFGRDSDLMTDEPPNMPSGDYIDEILQKMIYSMDERHDSDRHGSVNSSGSTTLPSVSTASTPQTQQPQQQQPQQPASRQNPGKAGKSGGGKSETGKGSARKTGTKGKGRKGGTGRGGGGGGGKGDKVSSSSSSVESLSDVVDSIRPTPDVTNRELEMLSKTQNKTKEANGTKTRRPLSKQ